METIKDNVQPDAEVYERYEAKGKQVWIEFNNKSGAGKWAIAMCYTPEIANEIADALNKTQKSLHKSH